MRHAIALGCCAVVTFIFSGVRLQAKHPIFAYDLDVVPEFSTLTVTGGFAGVHQTYRVDGQLGLTLDRHPHPPETVNAQFGLVDATLHGDGSFNGEELDALLKMTNWQGVLIDDDLLSFTGEDSQGAPIAAVAEFSGSRLRIRASNFPGCCDFFNYSLDLVALNRLNEHGHAHADFDEDGDVDGDDLVSALVNFGQGAGATHALGDADEDGDVDRLDISIWQSSLGTGVATDVLTSAAIPEPASWALIVLSAAAACAWPAGLRSARRWLRRNALN